MKPRLFQIRRLFFRTEITPGESREEVNGNLEGQDPYRITICPLCVQIHTIPLLGIPLPKPSDNFRNENAAQPPKDWLNEGGIK